MELLEGIETRRSCRGFKSTPINKEILEHILEVASRSPSYTNTQPWEVAVITGEKRDRLSEILCAKSRAGEAYNADLPLPQNWPVALDTRAREHGTRRFQAVGIDRANEQQRKDMQLQNLKFYGAPCALFLFMERGLPIWSIYDMGLFSENVCLAARAFGLETCLQASLVFYSGAVRDFLGIPSTKALVIGISIGYPDWDAPLNGYHSRRTGMEEFTQWHE
jgi:nitroreductase